MAAGPAVELGEMTESVKMMYESCGPKVRRCGGGGTTMRSTGFTAAAAGVRFRTRLYICGYGMRRGGAAVFEEEAAGAVNLSEADKKSYVDGDNAATESWTCWPAPAAG